MSRKRAIESRLVLLLLLLLLLPLIVIPSPIPSRGPICCACCCWWSCSTIECLIVCINKEAHREMQVKVSECH